MQYATMKVVLGSSSIRAFVAAPKHLKVVGVVRLGQEYGLLALDEQGHYLRVNGSQNEELDPRAVQRALQIAREAGHHEADYQHAAAAHAPTVVVRKRRRVMEACPA